MYILKNAAANIFRNKNRNILLGIILFAIILTTSISIIINLTSVEIINGYKAKFGSEVTLTNMANRDDKEKQKPLESSKLLSFAESKYVQAKEMTAEIAIIPENLNVLDDSSTPLENGALSAKAMLKGSSNPKIDNDFEKGIKKVKEGKMYTKNTNECIVSAKFAELNKLKVGDKINVISNIKDNPMKIVLIINGIYENKSIMNSSQSSISLYNPNNHIYTNFETVVDSQIFKTYGIMDVKMLLKDPDMLKAFKKELKAKGLPDYYEVTTDEDTYHLIVAPIEKIANISNNTTIAILGCGSAILLLLSLMTIRERKYEIGVLRAMGMKKSKVALGLVIESLIIMAVCLILGLSVAKLSQKTISKVIVETQIKETKEQNIVVEKVGFTKEAIKNISLMSLGLVMVSSLSGVFVVTRFEPSKILSEEN